MKPAHWLAAGLLLCSLAAPGVAVEPGPVVGAPAPSFELGSLDGATVSLESLRDKFVVLHFGTGW